MMSQNRGHVFSCNHGDIIGIYHCHHGTSSRMWFIISQWCLNHGIYWIVMSEMINHWIFSNSKCWRNESFGLLLNTTLDLETPFFFTGFIYIYLGSPFGFHHSKGHFWPPQIQTYLNHLRFPKMEVPHFNHPKLDHLWSCLTILVLKPLVTWRNPHFQKP